MKKCDRCDVSFNICEKLGRYEDWEEEQELFQEIVKAIRNGAIDDLSREIKALLPAAYWKDDPEIGCKADDTTKTLFELREKIDKVAEKLKA